MALALVGLGLSDTSETISSPIWKRIAAARILRKVGACSHSIVFLCGCFFFVLRRFGKILFPLTMN